MTSSLCHMMNQGWWTYKGKCDFSEELIFLDKTKKKAPFNCSE